ncbi:MAG: hypothetical protein D6772_16665 [Bacteroidetes bacterium]|nr:MAG: hypothetical protein D6772_16665 [Bacteroidota bacterium]
MSIRSYLLLLPAFLWAACSCPPDEKEGDLSLSDQAVAFLNYDNDTELTFVDETGTPLVLSLSRGEEVSTDRLCVRTTCTEAKFGSPSSCAYYAAESRRYTFFSADNEVALDVLLYSDVYQYGKAEFLDALQVGLSIGIPSITGRHLIVTRFADPNPDIVPLTDLFEETTELTLNGKAFTDLLRYEEGNLAIYVKPGLGVIGFKNAEHTWVLEE